MQGMMLRTEGISRETLLKPKIKKYYLEVPKATLQDSRSDEDRFLTVLSEEYDLGEITIEHSALVKLPSVLREGNWKVTVTLWGQRVIDVEPGDTSGRSLGIAADIGTTKIALYLLDLAQGKELAAVSALNPQRSYGEDIMTRMTFANKEQQNLRRLHELVVQGLNDLISQACRLAGVDESGIYEAVLVGNTVMHHFLLKLQTKYLGQSPYAQVLRRSFDCAPSAVGLTMNASGSIHTLPTIRSFVGADNVAVCLVTRIAESEKPALALDIGTNTEIDCGHKTGSLTVTSAASGPAFEGWGTRFGMPATNGAVDHVSIDPVESGNYVSYGRK